MRIAQKLLTLVLMLVLCSSLSAQPLTKTVPAKLLPEVSSGKIIYFPTQHNAERSLEAMLPSGAIPEEKVLDSTVLAGRALELAVMYYYTGEEKYLKGYERVRGFLQESYRLYGIYPELLSLSGRALSFRNNTFVQDAIKAGDLLTGRVQNLPELEFEEELTLKCTPLYQFEQSLFTLEECPYLQEYELRYGNRSAVLVCNASDSTKVRARWRVDPGALFRQALKPEDIEVLQVYHIKDGHEEEVDYDEGVLRGIQLHAISKGVKFYREAFVRRAFSDPDFIKGFYQEPGNLKQSIAYQFKHVLFYGGAGREYMLKYARKISLLKGRIELNGLYTNLSLTYEIPVRGKIIKEVRDGFEFVKDSGKILLRVHGGRLYYNSSAELLRLSGIDLSKPQVVWAEVLFYRAKPTIEFRAHTLEEFFTKPVVWSNRTELSLRTHYYYADDWEKMSFDASSLLCEAVDNPEVLHLAVSNYLAQNPASPLASRLYRAVLTLDGEELKSLPEEIRLPQCTIYRVQLERALKSYEQIYTEALLSRIKAELYASFQRGENYSAASSLIAEAGLLQIDEAEKLLSDYYYAVVHNSTEYERWHNFLGHYYPELVSAVEQKRYAEAEQLLANVSDERARQIFARELERRRAELKAQREELLAEVRVQVSSSMPLSQSLSSAIAEYLGELEHWNASDREMEKIYALRDEPELLRELLGIPEEVQHEKPEQQVQVVQPPENISAVEVPQHKPQQSSAGLITALLVLVLAVALVLWKMRSRGWRG